MILFQQPDSMEQTWEFLTDVITSYNGTEQRLAIRKDPKQRFSLEFTFDNYQDLRLAKADIFLNTAPETDEIFFPVWNEGVVLTAEATFGTVDVAGDFSKSDIAAGDVVMFLNPDGDHEVHTVSLKDDTSLTLQSFLNDSYPAGQMVYLAYQVNVLEQPSFDVYPVNAAVLKLSILPTTQPALVGYGGTVSTTYSSHKVLTARTLMGGTAGYVFDQQFEAWETENNFYQNTATPYSTIASSKRYLVTSPTERQTWKKFFSDIAGGREAFWVPTWQSDLEVVAQPSSTTIKVSKELNYKTYYYDTNARKDLQLLMTNGTVAYRSVTNCVINGDDTQTLTLNSSYTGTVESVSFLELSRLSGNQVSWSHCAGYSEVKFSVLTVRS